MEQTTTAPTATEILDENDFLVSERMLRLHNGSVITCPNCGWEYTRPVAVEVRTGGGGNAVRVDLETGEVSLYPELHASCCRRQVLTVQVEREQCGAAGDPANMLEVREEQGNTVLEWAG